MERLQCLYVQLIITWKWTVAVGEFAEMEFGADRLDDANHWGHEWMKPNSFAIYSN